MRHFMRVFRLPVAQVITASLVALAMPVAPARSAVLDDLFERPGPNLYRRCAEDLTRAKVSTTETADACSKAFRPDDLGVCVRRMTEVQVAGPDALSVCRQVRRPLDASTCVVDIGRKATQTVFADVLDNCRRSLLPVQFSQCVVGLNQKLKISTKDAIDSCINATDRPNDVLPVSIPGSNLPPQIPTTTPTYPSTTNPSTPTTNPSTPATNPSSTPDTPLPPGSSPSTQPR